MKKIRRETGDGKRETKDRSETTAGGRAGKRVAASTSGSRDGKSGRPNSSSAPSSGLQISNPDKVFWPDEGYTKLDLIRFYDETFESLRPWVEDRLLSLKRCPNGLLGNCFFQKEKPETMPADTPTHRIVHENGVRNYVVGGKKETQLALVNLGCIAVHVWGSRRRDPAVARQMIDWLAVLEQKTRGNLDRDEAQLIEAILYELRMKYVERAKRAGS